MSGAPERDAESAEELPLAGVHVVELARLLPGPWAGSLLADYGADVVKVEQPGRGDYSRSASPRYVDESVYFCTVNRNKRSMTLDLSRPAGQQVFRRLAARADVVLESFRPGVSDRLGIGYATLSQDNPKLIYCAVTGYGQTGPYRLSAGHDLNIAGLSGLLRPIPERVPEPSGLQMADFAAASTAVMAVLLALRQRDQTGRGQYLDIAMLDSLLSWAGITGASSFAGLAGHPREPRMEVFGANPRYTVYRCADGGYVTVSLLERPFWEKFANVVGRPDLINPEETEADRLSDHGAHGVRYRRELTALFAARGRDAWVTLLQSADVPCWPIYEPDEVSADPQVQARHMVRWVDDPVQGRIPQWGFPIKSDAMRPAITRAAPGCGEHTDEVLADLGLSGTEMRQLRKEGVV